MSSSSSSDLYSFGPNLTGYFGPKPSRIKNVFGPNPQDQNGSQRRSSVGTACEFNRPKVEI
jgi:hypothetical protein